MNIICKVLCRYVGLWFHYGGEREMSYAYQKVKVVFPDGMVALVREFVCELVDDEDNP